jgi:hypothetical protein
VDVDTPVTQAMRETPPGGDPRIAFRRTSRRFLLQLHQALRILSRPSPRVFLTVALMTDAGSARATVNPANPLAVVVSRLPLAQPLGEASIAWQWPIVEPGGSPR